MTPPSVPPGSLEIYRAAERALGDRSLSERDWQAFSTFVNREAPPLLAVDSTTYLVLGSYRPPYVPQVNQVQHELDRRPGSYTVKIGDMVDPETADVPEFRVKFHVAATLADWIVGVYEQEAGGEAPELGKLSEVYPGKTYVLPRDYAIDFGHVETREEALAAATAIYFDDGTAESEKKAALRELVASARSNGAAVTADDLVDFLAGREDRDYEVVEYSWVHRQEFRFFDGNRTCLPWTTDDGHRMQARRVPGPAKPTWPTEG